MSLENVRAFYERLATDEVFRTQLQGVNSKDECSQVAQKAGYDFTQEEFEEYTSELLDSSATEDDLTELNQKELEAVMGGTNQGNGRSEGRNSGLTDFFQKLILEQHHGIRYPRVQAMYGVILRGRRF